MHVPDGFLDLRTAATTAGLSLSGLSLALARLRDGLPRRRIPLMGLAAAFLFAAQMLNFPVAAGTSGHLVGAVLSAVLLGPSAAVVVMTAVLVVQALLFADGGILALGANVFNMAILGVFGGFPLFRAVERLLPGERGLLAATAFASWWSIVLASTACAVELAISGVAPWRLVLPAMAGTHLVIGLGEAVIATLVTAAVLRTRPDLIAVPDASRREAARSTSRRYLPLTVALMAIAAAIVAFPFATGRPDGLERVAEALGFALRAQSATAPLAGYRVPGLASSLAAAWAAGLAGVLLAFALSYALAMALAPRRKPGPGSRI